jgi:hypothetical protein
MREHNLNTLEIQSQHYLHERRIERTRDRLAEVAGHLAQRPHRAMQLRLAVRLIRRSFRGRLSKPLGVARLSPTPG